MKAVDDDVVLCSQGQMWRIDPRTGDLVWDIPVELGSCSDTGQELSGWSSIAIRDSSILALRRVVAESHLLVVSAATGEVLEEANLTGSAVGLEAFGDYVVVRISNDVYDLDRDSFDWFAPDYLIADLSGSALDFVTLEAVYLIGMDALGYFYGSEVPVDDDGNRGDESSFKAFAPGSAEVQWEWAIHHQGFHIVAGRLFLVEGNLNTGEDGIVTAYR